MSQYVERCYIFFFSSRRRHTRWPRDWSSDVCSSDLGFTAGRAASSRGHTPAISTAAALRRPVASGTARRPEPLVEALRPFIGLWVAVRGDEVLVAAPSPKEVVAWLAKHRQRAQSMFRVPDSEQAITGAAPQ